MNPQTPATPYSNGDNPELLARITASIQDGLTVIENGRIVFINDRACEIFGRSREDLGRTTGTQLAAPEERGRLERLRRDLKNSTVTSAETDFWIVREDGTRRFVRNRYQIDRREDALRRWFVFTTDITEHKLTMEALTASERQLREFLKYSPVGVYRTTPDGRILMANPALVRMLGYSAFEDLAKRNLEGEGFEPSYPRDEFRSRIEHDGEVRGLEVAWKRKDGTVAELSENARVVRDENGKVLYYEGTVEDITERKRTLRRLQESEQRYRELIEALPHGVSILQHGRIVFANKAGASMLGYDDPAELIGKPASEGLAVEERDRVLRLLRTALDQNGPWPVHYTATGLRRDGTRFPAEVYCTRVSFGQHRALQVFLMDLSEHQRAERERQQLQSQLYQADKMTTVGQLAAGVAHEINNPLAFLLPNMDVLRDECARLVACARDPARHADTRRLGEELAGILDDCTNGLLRIRDITGELRQFSRIDDEAAERVQLQDLLESALTLAHNQIKYRARVERDYAEIPAVVVNRGKLLQVFLNLLINAAQAIEEGKMEQHRIRVSTGRHGGEVFAQVANNGAPIPAEVREKVFDPFFTTKPRGQGTGLGLSIAYSIVQQHRGHIELEDHPELGTVFRVRVPLDTGMHPEAVAADAGTASTTRTAHILAVDDEAGIRNALQIMLKPHQVTTASNGREALALIATSQRFDLILCDLMMPEMTGMEVAERILSDHPDLAGRLILMTGGAFTPKAAAYVRQSGLPRLEKPMEADALHRFVETYLRQVGEEDT